MNTVKLKKNKHLPFHPWVFGGAILNPGEFEKLPNISQVKILNNEDLFVGYGLINHNSQIKIRIYSFDENKMITNEYIENLLSKSFKLREHIYGKTLENLSCRLVFSESDSLSGLVIDKFLDYLVFQFTSLALFQYMDTIKNYCVKKLSPKGIFLRTEKGTRENEHLLVSDQLLYGEKNPEDFTIKENGIKFKVDISQGQKTGFYFDQKDNRQMIREYSKDKKVLDLCCYSGGFALNAAYGGARSVLGIDVSESAVELARENSRINNLTDIRFLRSDMFSFCRDQKEKGKKYGLIILDPPKFTHSKSGISQAIRGYININSLAMDLLEENGILVSCSCSGRVSLQQFENALLSAGLKSHKHIKILDIKIQNKDHPVLLTCQETLYLKCFVLSCSNIRE